jgi:hypothetical protein
LDVYYPRVTHARARQPRRRPLWRTFSLVTRNATARWR